MTAREIIARALMRAYSEGAGMRGDDGWREFWGEAGAVIKQIDGDSNECICPKCGIRHGLDRVSDGSF